MSDEEGAPDEGGEENEGGDEAPPGPEGFVPRPIKGSLTQDPNAMLPIYVMTGIFGGIFILGPLVIRRKVPNKDLIRCCIMLTAFFMWLLWFTVYVAQMNPLVGPRLHRNIIEWMAHTWGNDLEEEQSDLRMESRFEARSTDNEQPIDDALPRQDFRRRGPPMF